MESIYTSLENANSIRLLTILPAGLDGALRCTMRNVDLEKPPEYVALSYTWGSATDERDVEDLSWQCIIMCNKLHFEITSNLFNALTTIRDLPNSSKRQIWIDAICINQNDLGERAAQVRMMGQIFGAASEVYVWLGVWTPSLEMAYDTVQILNKLPTERPDVVLSHWTDPQTYSTLGIPRISPEHWSALCSLLARRWFRRVWTM